MPKKIFIFCFCSVPFLFHLFSFNIFFFFLSSLFSLFTFPFHPFVHPFLLFSPFSLLPFLHSFFFSPSHVSLFFFFSIAVFCVSSFCLTSLFFSLFCSWSHFSFHTSSLPCFSSSPYLFFLPKIFKNFCGQFFLMKFCLCFLTPPFFGVSYLLFFLSLSRPHSLFVPWFTNY